MTQIITSRWGWQWWWGGGGDWDMKKAVYDPQNIGKDAFDYENFTNTPTIPTEVSELDNDAWYITSSALSGYQTTSNLVTNLTNPDDTHYPSAKAVSDAITSAGGWDMLKSVYDPNNVSANAFDYDNFINTPTIPTNSDYVDLSTNQTVGWTKTFTTSPVVPSKSTDATNTATAIATEAQVYKKQDKLTTQTAYTSKWTASKVPQITTNSLWQVTGITEVSISYPSQVSDTAYGSSWDWVTTTAPSKNAVYDKINSIDWLIPSAATSSNKLTDKNYVDDSINSVTAYYITKNAAWDQWASYAELAAATTFYSWWVVRVPTRNDYTIVLDDENHDHATTRYIYNSGWEYQYTVNETALTQAQLDALNSWITSWKVSTYDGYASGKQDTLTLPATPTSWHLVTWGANNKTLADGWVIPTVPTNVSSFNNDAGYLTSSTWVTSVNGKVWDVLVQAQHSSLTATLTSAWWSSSEQTVSVSGVTASNTVIVSPSPSSMSAYTNAKVYCSAQGSNSLTFSCTDTPTGDIVVNVVILN